MRVEEVRRAENLAMRVAEMGGGAEDNAVEGVGGKASVVVGVRRSERAVEVQDRMVVVMAEEATVPEKSAVVVPGEGQGSAGEDPVAAFEAEAAVGAVAGMVLAKVVAEARAVAGWANEKQHKSKTRCF